MFILPWNSASKSVKALRETGHFKVIRREGSRFRPSANKTVLNYGCSQFNPIDISVCRIYNKFEHVRTASNKLRFFEKMSQGDDQPRTPDWTTEPQTALSWFTDRQDIIARTTLSESGGRGISFFSDYRRAHGSVDSLLSAPLFVKYKKKAAEYRVHYIRADDGTVHKICEQRKVLRRTDEEGREIATTAETFRIRSHQNGFIFQRENINVPEDVLEQSRLAFVKSELDLGAVDVIWNEHEQNAYVLEINTAPGLEGQTVTDYATAIQECWSN